MSELSKKLAEIIAPSNALDDALMVNMIETMKTSLPPDFPLSAERMANLYLGELNKIVEENKGHMAGLLAEVLTEDEMSSLIDTYQDPTFVRFRSVILPGIMRGRSEQVAQQSQAAMFTLLTRLEEELDRAESPQHEG